MDKQVRSSTYAIALREIEREPLRFFAINPELSGAYVDPRRLLWF